jgi:hypothetical protein
MWRKCGWDTHKDVTDQYAEKLGEDVKYRRKWCERIGLGLANPDRLRLLGTWSCSSSRLNESPSTGVLAKDNT